MNLSTKLQYKVQKYNYKHFILMKKVYFKNESINNKNILEI